MREIIGSCVEQRFVRTYEEMARKIAALREIGFTIGLTSGSWDLLHTGHQRYIERLKERVGIVVIGVDSDEKIRQRKGPDRPIIPENERLEILCHSRHVDLVFLKAPGDEKKQLIKTVKPDVLLVSERSHRSEEELEELRQFCGELMLLESQATTSTTAKIRQLLVSNTTELARRFREAKGRVVQELDAVEGVIRELRGDKDE